MRKSYLRKPIFLGILSYLMVLLFSSYAQGGTSNLVFRQGSGSCTTCTTYGSQAQSPLTPTDPYDFGSSQVGVSQSPVNFVVRNTGSATASVTLTNVSGLYLILSGANPSDFVIDQSAVVALSPAGVIATNTSVQITITFTPSGVGARTATISIGTNGNGSDNPYVVYLTGTGLVPSMNIKQGATTYASASTFNFGSTNINSSIGPTTFTIQNTATNAILHLSGTPIVGISGTNAADYAISQGSTTATVGTSSSTTFTITFTPSGAGARTATISIASDDPSNNPYTINLTGTGTGTSISVTAPTKKDYCLNSAATLGDIVFTELTGVEMAAGSDYLFITAPTGFEFVTGNGSVNFTASKDITAASFLFQSTSVIAVSYTVGGITKQDVLTISGLKMQATSITSSVDLIFGTGSTDILGLTQGTSVLGTVATGVASISLGSVSPLCTNVNPVTLNGNNTLNTGTATVAYTSSPTTGAITGTNLFRPANVGSNGTQTITYTVNTSGGCAFTATTSIDVNVAPSVSIAIDDTSGAANNDRKVCAGATINLIGSGANTYTFYQNPFPGTNLGTTNGMSVSSFNDGDTFTTIGVATNGCKDTATSLSITKYALPTVTWNPNTTSFGQGAPANDLNTNGTYSPSGGVFSGHAVYFDFIATHYKFDPGAASLGGNTLAYTYTDSHGCSATKTATFTIASGSVDIGGWGNVCYGTPSVTITWPTASVPAGSDLYFYYYDYRYGYQLNLASVVGANYQATITPAYMTYTNSYQTSASIYIYYYDNGTGYFNYLGYESGFINPSPTVAITNNFFSPIYYHCPNETQMVLTTTPSATTATSVFTYSAAGAGFVHSPSTDVFQIDWSKGYTWPSSNSITFTYTDPVTTCSGSITASGIYVDPPGSVPTVTTPGNPYCTGTSVTNLTANKQSGYYTYWYSVVGGVESLVYQDVSNYSSTTTTYSPGVLTNSTNNAVTYTYRVKQTNTYQDCLSNSSSDLNVVVNPALSISAGVPTNYVCGDGSTINLTGTINVPTMYGAVATNWTSSGDGNFTNGNTLTPTYSPGPNDKLLGNATLTIKSADPDGNAAVACPAVSSSSSLIITTPATVNAKLGAPYNFCASQPTMQLLATKSTNVTATWTGTDAANLSSTSSLSPLYTPTGIQQNGGVYDNITANRAPSVIKIALVTTDPDGAGATGPCPTVSDTAVINIYPQLTVDAGADINVCAGTAINLSGSVLIGDQSRVTTNSSINTWSPVVAGGIISPNGPNNFTAVYSPSGNINNNSGELGNGGNITLRLTSSAPTGSPCPAASDDINIVINQRARVSAGVDTVYCASDVLKLNGQILTNAVTSITWSGKPVGDFSDATVRNPILTSSTPTDYYGGVYDPSTGTKPAVSFTLTLTGNDPVGPCNAESDDVMVSINPTLTVDAGPDYSICGHKLMPSLKTLVSNADIKLGVITDRLSTASVNSWSVYSGAGSLSGTNFSSNFNVNYQPSGTLADSGLVISSGSGEFGNLSTVTLMLKSKDPDLSGPCKADSDFVNITLYPRPIPHFKKFAIEYCKNTPFVRPEGNIDYRISGNAFFSGTGISTFGDEFKFDPGDATIPPQGATFPIEYKQTDVNGCYNFVDTTVNVYPVPVVSYTTSSKCQYDTITFKSTSTVLGTQFSSSKMVDWNWAIDSDTIQNVYFYNLDPNAGPIVNPTYSLHDSTTKYSFLNYGLHSIHLQVASNSGGTLNCINQKDTIVTFGPYPSVDFTWSRPCLGDTVFYVNNSSIAPGYSKSTYWKMNDPSGNSHSNYKAGTDSSSLAPKFKFDLPGIYKVQLIDTTKTYKCVSIKTKEVYIVPTYSITPSDPYDSSFASTRDWAPSGYLDKPYSWQNGTPSSAKQVIKPGGGSPAWAGNNVWITNKSGNYIEGELSYLNSPCFNLTTLDKPMMVLKNWSSSTNLAGAMVEATIGNNNPWTTIGSIGTGTNWYNTPGVVGLIGTSSAYNPLAQGFSGLDTTFRLSRIGLSQFANENQLVRFRITFGSANVDDPLNQKDGLALDSIWIGNRSKVVLMEHFTNSISAPCVTASDTVNSIQAQRPGDVISVHYHTNFPGVDKMNQKSDVDVTSKILYYGFTSVPVTQVDGLQTYNQYGNTPGAINTAIIDNKALEDALFGLDLSCNKTGYNLDIKALLTPKSTITGQNVVLNVAVLEKQISYANGLGNNNNTNGYQWVMRKMLPDAAGTYISRDWHPTKTHTDSIGIPLSWTFQLGDFYDTSKIEIVAFVQNYQTKEVYQAAKIGANGSTTAIPIVTGITKVDTEDNLMVYPVPSDDEINVLFANDTKEEADYTLMNELGVSVASGKIAKGVRMLTFNSKSYAAGVYFLNIMKNDGSRINKKIMVIH